MPGVIDTIALLVVAGLAPTTVLGSNLLYFGTLAAIGTPFYRGACMIDMEARP